MDVAFHRAQKQLDPVWRAKEARRCVEKAKRQAPLVRGTKKGRARIALQCALRWGKITKPLHCESCGVNPGKPLDGHHDDYDKPLQVKWLCRQCHVNLHARQRWAFNIVAPVEVTV